MFNEGDVAEVDIVHGVVKNVTTSQVLTTTPLPPFLLAIVEAGGLLALLERDGFIEKEASE